MDLAFVATVAEAFVTVTATVVGFFTASARQAIRGSSVELAMAS